jgi:uncharacterized protein
MPTVNKRKIFNDPVYGFVSISYDVVHDLIEHPWFQRLSRIKQLGLSHYVYPGALHTRFQHAMGAMHLMKLALESLREKGVEISEDEAIGVTIAVLLHDIGHGPYSHTLENTIVQGVHHEELSLLIMQKLNEQFNLKLTTAIAIFNDTYPKKFLHQLVSSQLDMDRLDYLGRDSFFTGVSEGVISSERIIKMLRVVNDQLIIEEKGIYSIEKFIVARRLMYWQVYLHKTVIAAEFILIKILVRAQELARSKKEIFASPSLNYFLNNKIEWSDFVKKEEVLEHFVALDDYDIFGAIKVWAKHDDKILSTLCKSLVHRKLFKIEISNQPFAADYIDGIKQKIKNSFHLSEPEMDYFMIADTISNFAYNNKEERINILMKTGAVIDITDASDNFNLKAQTTIVSKYFICYPKEMG